MVLDHDKGTELGSYTTSALTVKESLVFFYLLTAILRLFGVFCYISFVNFERVYRSSQMTEKPRFRHIFIFYHYLLTAMKIV